MASHIILKVFRRAEWEKYHTLLFLEGSPDDKRDGFIHFSTAAQLRKTVEKHFGDVDELVLLEVDARKLEDRLKWEVSRDGELFPHLYGELDASAILRTSQCQRQDDGYFDFPVLLEHPDKQGENRP